MTWYLFSLLLVCLSITLGQSKLFQRHCIMKTRLSIFTLNRKFMSKIYDFSLLIKVYGLRTGADDIFMTWYLFPLLLVCLSIALDQSKLFHCIMKTRLSSFTPQMENLGQKYTTFTFKQSLIMSSSGNLMFW